MLKKLVVGIFFGQYVMLSLVLINHLIHFFYLKYRPEYKF